MAYGGLWGFTSSVGASPSDGGPYLVSSTPADGDANVSPSAGVSFVLSSAAGVDQTTVSVIIGGTQAMIEGAFLAGYAGTIVTDGDNVEVEFTTIPDFLSVAQVYCVIYAADNAGDTAVMQFSFVVALDGVTELQIDTWCEGKRLDLAWTLPAEVTKVKLLRSRRGYCYYDTDEADTVYDGVAVEVYQDTDLEENAVYYYSLFVTYNTGAPYTYRVTSAGQAAGLSIPDYAAKAQSGWAVLNWFSRRMRERDADPSRGANRNVLSGLADLIQCGLNLARGHIDSLTLFRDPDTMPAGQLGKAENQLGILAAACWDVDFSPERTYDAGTLRRILLGIVPDVYQVKGTCPSLVGLVKLVTTWDCRCDELTEPVCGVDRVFRAASLSSTLRVAIGYNTVTVSTGSITTDPAQVYLPDTTTLDALLAPTDYVGCFMLDALGTFACVASVAGNVITFEDAAAALRKELVGSGTTPGANLFDFTMSTGSYPWQFPSPADPPEFGPNALVGLTIIDSAGSKLVITASAATVGGVTQVTTAAGTPTNGAAAISYGFGGGTYAGRVPRFFGRIYYGRFSLTYSPLWDTRLLAENVTGPWSQFTSSSVINPLTGYGATTEDVVLWVDGEASLVGTVTSAGNNYVQDSTKAWTFDEWQGYYLLPNWDQRRVYRIVSNSATQLTVDDGDLPLNIISAEKSSYVILSAKNANRYNAINRQLPSFIPNGVRPFIKYE